jgi:hypothetical protein
MTESPAPRKMPQQHYTKGRGVGTLRKDGADVENKVLIAVTLTATEGNLATYHAGEHQANTGIIRRRKFCNANETGRQSILKS